MDGGRIGQSNSGASSSSSKSNALGKMGRFFKRMVKHTTSSRSKRSEVSSAAQAPEKDSEMPSLESRNAAVRNSKMYQETLTPIVGYRGSLMDQMLDQIDLGA